METLAQFLQTAILIRRVELIRENPSGFKACNYRKMINCRWGVNQLGIFAWRENVRNPDVAARAENIATDVLFGLSVIPSFLATWWRRNTLFAETILPFAQRATEKKEFLLARENTEGGGVGEGNGQKGEGDGATVVQGRRRGGSDWCAGQEAAREWWIETKRRLRNTRWRSR